MKLGIVGLPNVGKSTLFKRNYRRARKAQTIRSAPSTRTSAWSLYRMSVCGHLYHAKKTTPAVVEFVVIAGLVRGASKGGSRPPNVASFPP